MFRRLISSCVLAGFLVAQWAAMPHGHARGTQLPDDLTASPHIHLSSFFGSSHDNGHSHRNEPGHIHRYDTPTGERECVLDECGLVGIVDHDKDVVYLPTLVSIAAAGGINQCKLLTTPVVPHFLVGAAFLNAAPSHHVASLRRPDERDSGCALFIALRTLRI